MQNILYISALLLTHQPHFADKSGSVGNAAATLLLYSIAPSVMKHAAGFTQTLTHLWTQPFTHAGACV